ncbi:hypothetical protein F511_47562 [Dorcoceras hygrometricum]|uniref:Uncharacterized protein n=1 Tax=Dorcoceras hygrometricum TaxID=472368 RepID=A0A2Z6ZX57_9LAMI|nr:hypothetical protein F511_47562 [Dorcoceras hygrometricum]
MRGQCAWRRVRCGSRDGPPREAAAGRWFQNVCFVSILKRDLDTIWQYRIDQIRKPGSDTTVGKPRRIRITPPGEAAEEQNNGRETINTIK